MRPSGTPHELEERRLRAVRLLDEGFSPVEVARQVGVDRRSVRRWKAAARKGGASAVAAEPVNDFIGASRAATLATSAQDTVAFTSSYV